MKRRRFPQTAPTTLPTGQRSILNSRWREATARQPELKKLLQVLLGIGGDFVVAPPFPDLDVEELIASGFVLGGSHRPEEGTSQQMSRERGGALAVS